MPGHRRRNHLPKFLEFGHALLARIAGDDRGIDGADRDAGDPIRLEIATAERLIGPGLVGTERAAPLKDQHALRIRGRACRHWVGIFRHLYRSDSERKPQRGVSSPPRQPAPRVALITIPRLARQESTSRTPCIWYSEHNSP